MSDALLRARLADAVSTLQRVSSDLTTVSAGLTETVRLDPINEPAFPVWVVALPFYWCADRERREVTRRIFHHYRNLADQLGVRITGVGSEGKVSRGLWIEFFDEVDYREYPQTFSATNSGGAGLREKFDETIRATRHLDPERVFIGGSDDLIPIDWYAKAFASDADLVGVTGGAVVIGMQRGQPNRSHVWDGIYTHATDVEFCGGGLVLGRRLLDAWEWAPFAQPGDEVGIERAARAQGYLCEGIPGPFFAVKCGKVLNGYNVAGRHGAQPGGTEVVAAFRAHWDALA
jgi:hypothetical protein